MILIHVESEINAAELLQHIAKCYDLQVTVVAPVTPPVADLPNIAYTTSTTAGPDGISPGEAKELIKTFEELTKTLNVTPDALQNAEQTFGKVCKTCGNPFTSTWKAARLCDACNLEKSKKVSLSSPAPG